MYRNLRRMPHRRSIAPVSTSDAFSISSQCFSWSNSRRKPLRFFGLIGSATFAIGGLVLLVVVFQRLFLDVSLADRPALLLSSLFVVLGVQLFGLGLIGELIIFTHARELKEYTIDEIVDGPAD